MKRQFYFFYILFAVLFLSSCTTTFGGSVLVLGFKDILIYVGIGLIIAALIAFTYKDRWRKFFIIWVIINLLISPLPGLVWFLIRVTKKKKDQE